MKITTGRTYIFLKNGDEIPVEWTCTINSEYDPNLVRLELSAPGDSYGTLQQILDGEFDAD